MSGEIEESDWKVFRKLRVPALERFCQQILDEVRQISDDPDRGAHERYLAVYDLIRRRSRQIADAFDDPRRSATFRQILAIQSHRLLTDEELGRFSPELGDRVRSWTEKPSP